jgi:hypothetical protein
MDKMPKPGRPAGQQQFHTCAAVIHPMCLFSRFALCVIVAFSLGGCVAGGDEHGGMVSGVTTFTLPAAMIEANNWCGRYGLVAAETRMTHFENPDMGFACVPLPAKPQ